MSSKPRDFLLAALLAASLVACADGAPLEEAPPPTSATQEKAEKVRGAAEVDADAPASAEDAEALADDARRLSGLAPAEDGDVWARHAEAMDDLWSQMDERFLNGVRAFGQQYLPASQRPLIYPFGGPDLLHAVAFFPEARTYVLGGLEPPGRIADPDALDEASLEKELERLRGGFSNILQRGYFVSTQMERDFTVGQIDGFLPVITIFLARAGLTPTAVHYIALADDGAPIVLEQATPGTGGAVRISAVDAAGEPREIYYFSRDVSDAGLEQTPSFVEFLKRFESFDVYLKAGEYLLQMDSFTTFRDTLLTHAELVLQDDSGFAWKDLSDRETSLFGTYVETLANYRDWQQDDLRDAFAAAEATPLDFAIGYHALTEHGGCLILARRD